MSTQTGEVIREIRIEAAPAEVFAYFVDPDKLVVWKAVSAELDARPGGLFQMDVTGRGDTAHGEYLEINPPNRITFSWTWDSEAGLNSTSGGPSIVEITLTPVGDSTMLRLVHRGITGPNLEGKAAGWTHYLDRLAVAAAGHDPGPDPWARPRGEPTPMTENTASGKGVIS